MTQVPSTWELLAHSTRANPIPYVETMVPSSPTELILLLKTQSGSNDAYKELFSRSHDGRVFSPQFVPVLQHRFRDDEVHKLRQLLREKKLSRNPQAEFGGMIFTSQRAVEAFASVLQEGQGVLLLQFQCCCAEADLGGLHHSGNDPRWPCLLDVPFYSVGPATTRALSSIQSSPKLSIYGSHTGTGDVLAPYILDHYASQYPNRTPLPPLLFLVGETRRDIIPKTLMDPCLPLSRRIEVTEKVVYGTGVMESFPQNFAQVLRDSQGYKRVWIVVFSPTGCGSMLEVLGILDVKKGSIDVAKRDRNILIITIGPTTQRYLQEQFGFRADASAASPSPEGILDAIREYDKQAA